jgi:hypothetical protein
MADISKIQLPNGNIYDLVDKKSGSDIYYVTIGGTVTWNEVVSAYDSGKLIVGKFAMTTGSLTEVQYSSLVYFASDGASSTSGDVMQFYNPSSNLSSGEVGYISSWTPSNGWTYTTISLPVYDGTVTTP